MTRALPAKQVPALYHQRLGDWIVTAVGDGGMPVNAEILRGIEADEALKIMRDAGRSGPLMTAVNTFLVQSADRLVLVDAGAGSLMGPTTGKLLDNLAAIGVAPGDIDAVLVTHMHPDHVGGLLDAAGQAVFANAELLIPEPEAAFWLDEAKAAAAPEGARASFDFARKVAAAYGSRVRRFVGSPLPGIETVPLHGHSPGHSGYMLQSGDARLMIVADIFHAPEVQSRRPDVYVGFDADPAAAVASRKRALELAVTEHLLIAGMHMNFPGFGLVAREGEGYVVQPVAWLPVV